jgi:hypothetical protein
MSKYSDIELTTFVETVSLTEYLAMLRKKVQKVVDKQ